MTVSTIEGTFRAPDGARVGIVVARFNHFITDRLLEGALDALSRSGIDTKSTVVVKTPGAFELPWAVRRLAKSGEVDAVIALGAVIRGATPHFDYVAGEAAKGCGAAMQETGVPVLFGVITTDTIEQAIERAGTKAGNKGFEAALAAIEMLDLGRALSERGY